MTDLYAPIARHVVLPLWGVKQKTPYLRYIPAHLRNEKLPLEQLRELQWTRLKSIIEHAYTSTHYYKKLFDGLNLHPSDIRCPEDMLLIPVLSKEPINQNLEAFQAKSYNEADLIKTYTGGSTGSPLAFCRDRRCQGMRNAATACFEMWVNHYPGDKRALIWGALRDLSGNNSFKSAVTRTLVTRMIELNARGMTAESAISFARQLNRYRPKMVRAFPSAITNFARILTANREPIPRIPVVITSAEVLNPESRTFVESVFNCKVYDRYGSREVGEIAMECSQQNGYHLDLQSHYVEIVKGGRMAKAGEMGEVVITDLLNYGMPLIRYKQGDFAVAADRVCECGRPSPLIESIQGRTSDTLVSPDGRLVSGSSLPSQLGRLECGIRQVQIIQESLTKLRVRVAVGGDTEAAKSHLRKMIAEFLGEMMEIEFELVDSIPSEASGKYRYAISRLPQSEMDRAFQLSCKS